MTCEINGCDGKHIARGWCAAHYMRWKRDGNPGGAVLRRGTHGAGSVDADGYRRLFKPDHPAAMSTGYVMEHRMVWWDEYGSIPDGHHIHHIDGDKLNNDITNLQCLDGAEHVAMHRSAQ